MSNKVLVTKEFHRKALRAIAKNEHLEALQDENMELIRLAWMSWMESCCTDEQMDQFMEYCEAYKVELGLHNI